MRAVPRTRSSASVSNGISNAAEVIKCEGAHLISRSFDLAGRVRGNEDNYKPKLYEDAQMTIFHDMSCNSPIDWSVSSSKDSYSMPMLCLSLSCRGPSAWGYAFESSFVFRIVEKFTRHTDRNNAGVRKKRCQINPQKTDVTGRLTVHRIGVHRLPYLLR